jgi:predicted transcriptional regulator
LLIEKVGNSQISPTLKTSIVQNDKMQFKLNCVIVKHILKKREMFISVDAMDFVRAVLQDFTSGIIEYTLPNNK